MTNNFASYAIEFKCQFKNEGGWLDSGSVYSCGVSDPSNSECKNKLTKIKGDHKYAHDNNGVIGFWARGQVLESIPDDIGTIFLNIKRFWWNDESKLQTLTAKDLKQFPHLEAIALGAPAWRSV